MSSSPSSSPSSSCNQPYDVFISFRGHDVRYNFLGHLIKELDHKLINTFKDTEMKKGDSLSPVLTQTIKDSRIAVVLFSRNYASSGWCLNELLEIVKCHKEFGKRLITIFHHVEPTHVKKQTGHFGKVFKRTCDGKPEEMKNQWTKALTEVATVVGYHIQHRDDEAKCIEDIVRDLLGTLIRTPSGDFKDTVGIEDHIAKLNLMLDMEYESKKVRKVGIWGPSGIGKTTIARALCSQHSHKFDVFVFLDIRFTTKSTKNYTKGNLDDYNMKLSLEENFLSEILKQKDIKIGHLGVVEERVKNQKVLIVLDDVENQVVLETLIGGDKWFGLGSRIIVITKDKRLLEVHGIDHIYEVSFPSEMQALEIFCQSAFGQKFPHDGYMDLATEVAALAGGLPLGLSILGSTMKNRKVEDWKKELPMLRETLNGSIEGTLRLSYDKLDTDIEKAIFRHIACFFNGVETNSIMLMLPYKELKVENGLKHLVEKSLISVKQSWNNTYIVDMHCLVQEMGKQLVRAQSNDPGEREFLFDSEDVCNVLKTSSGTGKVLGISLDINEIDDCTLYENAFKGMHNLRYLRFYTNSWEEKKEVEWNLPERFEDFPPILKLLSWPGYPMEDMPSQFRPESLVELRMPNSKILKELWKGRKSLKHLKIMDLSECQNLTNIPDLSKATNLETLNLHDCSSLVEFPSSIMSLNKLTDLNIAGCTKLEDNLPSGDMESLIRLSVAGCSQLKTFPDFSKKISELNINKTAFQIFPSQMRLENLVTLSMEHIMSERLWEGVLYLTNLKTITLLGSANLKEIPDLSMATSLETLNLNNCSSLGELTRSSIQNLHKLTRLEMLGCSNLETLPTDINLQSLHRLILNGCSRLTSFPDISSNITILYLNQTAVEEVPPWIKNLSGLESLEMRGCKKLKCISPRIFELENLDEVFFSDCEQLADVIWPEKAEDTNNISTSFSIISFINCFNLNQDPFIQRAVSKCLIIPGEMPPYFTHRSTGSCFIIPIHQSSISQQSFLDFKVCLMVSDLDVVSKRSNTVDRYIDIEVRCRFRDKHGNYSEPATQEEFSFHQKYNHLIIFNCHIPLDLECDQVEIQFHLPKDIKLNRCGMRLSDDCTPISANQNEASDKYECIADNDGGYMTAVLEEECGDNSDDEGYETALDEEECCCDIVLTRHKEASC